MSELITTIGNFLLSSWIWSMTWGVSHLPISALIMMFMLKAIVRMRGRAVILLPLFSHLFAGLIFSLLVVGVVIHLLGFEYTWNEFAGRDLQELAMQSAIDLGLIYAVLETLFFVATRRWYHASIQWLFLTVFMSNAFAAWFIYRFLPML